MVAVFVLGALLAAVLLRALLGLAGTGENSACRCDQDP